MHQMRILTTYVHLFSVAQAEKFGNLKCDSKDPPPKKKKKKKLHPNRVLWNQVWLKLACPLWRRFLKIISYVNIREMVFPTVVMIWEKWNSNYYVCEEAFIYGSVVLVKIFNDPYLSLWLSILWRGLGPLFEQIWIPFTSGWFVSSLIELAKWFWKTWF
jgi:hypothetical protein